MDPAITPIIHSPRKVPIGLKDDIKSDLDYMEARGMISRVKEGGPTAWMNSPVFFRKAYGRLRICLDSKDLKEAIRREHRVTLILE